MTRCAWVGSDPRMVEYHDAVWGVPVADDTTLFEFLILEGAQAGLSWSTILNRREGYQRAFVGFDIDRVAAYTEVDAARLLQDPGIIRNRAKVAAAIRNAQVVQEIQRTEGSLSNYLWSFVGGKPLINHWKTLSEVPAETEEARAMSKALKQRGMGFVGPTICYAFMQATGMVNDHEISCFRHAQV